MLSTIAKIDAQQEYGNCWLRGFESEVLIECLQISEWLSNLKKDKKIFKKDKKRKSMADY